MGGLIAWQHHRHNTRPQGEDEVRQTQDEIKHKLLFMLFIAVGPAKYQKRGLDSHSLFRIFKLRANCRTEDDLQEEFT